MFRVLLTILLLLPFQFVSSIMRPSGWPHKKKLLHTLWTHLLNGARWDLDPGLPAHISDTRQFGVDCLHVVDPYGSVTLPLILPKKATIEP